MERALSLASVSICGLKVGSCPNDDHFVQRLFCPFLCLDDYFVLFCV